MCGSKNQQSTQNTGPPPEIMAQYRDLISRAKDVATAPYTPYGGALTAGFNADQFGGANTVRGAPNFLQAGANLTNLAASPISAAAINGYESPYNQDVINATLGNIQHNNAVQREGVLTNAIRQGNAFGGDRMGIAQAELARGQDMTTNQTIAGLENQNYSQALAAAQADATRQLQGAGIYSGLGSNMSTLGLQQFGIGTAAQQTDQGALNAMYQQFQQQQAFPYQQTGWLGNLVLGTGSQSGGTSTTTSPGPSLFSQILGGAATGVGAAMAFSDRRMKENIEPIGKTFDGQQIYRYNFKGSPKTEIGLIAQEVEHRHPQAVHDAGGVKMLDYNEATEGAAQRGHMAAGGVPYGGVGGPYSGGLSFIPDVTEQLAQRRGVGPPKAPTPPPQEDPAKQGMQSMMMGLKAGKASGKPVDITFGGSTPSGMGDIGWSGVDPMGGLGGLYAHGGLVPHMADAGPVPDDLYFDPTPLAPLARFDRKVPPGEILPPHGGLVPSARVAQGWDDVDQALRSGAFDPQGQNNPPSGLGLGEPGIMSYDAAPNAGSSRDFPPDLPPEIASGRSAGVAPTGVPRPMPAGEPSGGLVPIGTPPPRGDAIQRIAESPWLGLMMAGLGTMASRSPWVGPAIGEGAMQGLGVLQGQNAARVKQEQTALERQLKLDMHPTIIDAGDKTLVRYGGPNGQVMEFPKALSPSQAAHQDIEERKLAETQRLRKNQEMQPVDIGTVMDEYGQPRHIKGIRDPKTGDIYPIDPATGRVNRDPISAPQQKPEVDTSLPPGLITAQPADPLQDKGLPTNGVMPVSNVAPDWTRPEVLEGMKPKDANVVKAIAEGRQKFLPLTKNNVYNRFIMDKVHEYDPQVDESTYGRRQKTNNFFAVGTNGGGGQNIAAINTWAQHTAEFLRLSQELDLGRFKNFNEAYNWMTAHGFTTKQAQDKLAQLETVSKAVADEGAKVFAGSQSALADRKEWHRRFDASNPASVSLATAQEVAELVKGRLDSLANQYNEGMRTNHDTMKFIAPKTRAVLDRLASGERAPAKSETPASSGPPIGERKQFKQGWGVWDGTRWVPERAP